MNHESWCTEKMSLVLLPAPHLQHYIPGKNSSESLWSLIKFPVYKSGGMSCDLLPTTKKVKPVLTAVPTFSCSSTGNHLGKYFRWYSGFGQHVHIPRGTPPLAARAAQAWLTGYWNTLRHTTQRKPDDDGVTRLISWNNVMYLQSSGCVCVRLAPYGEELDNV